jgi:hypothetical protein
MTELETDEWKPVPFVGAKRLLVGTLPLAAPVTLCRRCPCPTCASVSLTCSAPPVTPDVRAPRPTTDRPCRSGTAKSPLTASLPSTAASSGYCAAGWLDPSQRSLGVFPPSVWASKTRVAAHHPTTAVTSPAKGTTTPGLCTKSQKDENTTKSEAQNEKSHRTRAATHSDSTASKTLNMCTSNSPPVYS